MDSSPTIADDPQEQFAEILNKTMHEAAAAKAGVVRLKAEMGQLKSLWRTISVARSDLEDDIYEHFDYYDNHL